MITVTVMKKQKILKNPGGNILKHGWEFSGGGGISTWGSLMGGNFPCGSFPGTRKFKYFSVY